MRKFLTCLYTLVSKFFCENIPDADAMSVDEKSEEYLISGLMGIIMYPEGEDSSCESQKQTRTYYNSSKYECSAFCIHASCHHIIIREAVYFTFSKFQKYTYYV